jgi:histidinol phosphatase-like PHP family hydrolase
MLKGTDYHIHTKYLKCADETMTLPAIVRRCEELGLRSIGIADHLNVRENYYQFAYIKRDIAALDTDLEVFFGVEINLLNGEGEIPYDEAMRDAIGFEFAIGGPHGAYVDHDDRRKIVEIHHRFLCQFAADPLIDVVVHPWWFGKGDFEKNRLRWFDDMSDIPDELSIEFAQIAREHHTAIEVNPEATYQNPKYSDQFKEDYRRYVALLNEQDVMFSLASDAHNINTLGITRGAEALLEELGVPDERIWTPRKAKSRATAGRGG